MAYTLQPCCAVSVWGTVPQRPRPQPVIMYLFNTMSRAAQSFFPDCNCQPLKEETTWVGRQGQAHQPHPKENMSNNKRNNMCFALVFSSIQI